MTSAQKRHAKPLRTKLLGVVHAGKRQLGLEDDEYRDLLERLVATRSAKGLSDSQLQQVIDEMRRRGFTQGEGAADRMRRLDPGYRPDSPHSRNAFRYRRDAVGKAVEGDRQRRMARALWHSLHYLGIVDDQTEKALCAWVKRQVGVERLEWADPGQLNACIEGLKDWAARDGGVVWNPPKGQSKNPRACVIRAQCMKLWGPDEARKVMTVLEDECAKSPTHEIAGLLDDMIRRYGARIREEAV